MTETVRAILNEMIDEIEFLHKELHSLEIRKANLEAVYDKLLEDGL